MTEDKSHPVAAAPEESEAKVTADESVITIVEAVPVTRRQKFRMVRRAISLRIRFIAVLAGVGMFIGYWDTVKNYWDKWTQPRTIAARQLKPGDEFFCPMDPQVVRSNYEPNGDVPNCPICGMPLSVRKKGEAAKLPEGITARVQLSPERIQLAGIETVPVDYRPIVKQTQTVGYVAYDESRLSKIVSRVGGYVEKLYVDKSFTVVHEGDPLAEIYSPELYSTAQELILATQRKSIGTLAASAGKTVALRRKSAGDRRHCGLRRRRRAAIGDPLAADGLRGGQENRSRRERGSQDDALRGGRPLDGLGRSRRF